MTTSVSHCTDLNDTFLQLPKATQVILVESQDDLVISRVSICLRHRCRVGARSADCNSHLAATGIHDSQPSPTRQLCFVTGPAFHHQQSRTFCKACCAMLKYSRWAMDWCMIFGP